MYVVVVGELIFCCELLGGTFLFFIFLLYYITYPGLSIQVFPVVLPLHVILKLLLEPWHSHFSGIPTYRSDLDRTCFSVAPIKLVTASVVATPTD